MLMIKFLGYPGKLFLFLFSQLVSEKGTEIIYLYIHVFKDMKEALVFAQKAEMKSKQKKQPNSDVIKFFG